MVCGFHEDRRMVSYMGTKGLRVSLATSDDGIAAPASWGFRR